MRCSKSAAVASKSEADSGGARAREGHDTTMASQPDVARAFARGLPAEDIPSASNFYAVAAPPDTGFDAVLLSYGWAVLAGRKGRQVVVFDGWRGYSASTSTQHGKMRRVFRKVLSESDLSFSSAQPKFGGNPLNWRVNKDGTDLADVETG